MTLTALRMATLSDLPALVAMGRRFHEAKQKRYPFRADSTEAFFSKMLSVGIVFIAEDGFLVGFAAGEPSNGRYVVAHEVFWWSEGRSGIRLRKAFEQWAKEMGCDEVQFSHPEGESVVSRLLERAGYAPATQVWRKPCA